MSKRVKNTTCETLKDSHKIPPSAKPCQRRLITPVEVRDVPATRSLSARRELNFL
jgi:hypothetical protein